MSDPNASNSPRRLYLRGEHIDALSNALVAAFDLSGLRQMTRTELNLTLENVVTVERPLRTIAFEFVQWVAPTITFSSSGCGMASSMRASTSKTTPRCQLSLLAHETTLRSTIIIGRIRA